MKVNIGPYKSNFIDCQKILSLYQKWFKKDILWMDSDDLSKMDKFVIWLYDKSSEVVRPLNRFLLNRIDRKVKIHIHDYDVWNMDETLAIIIHPMLVRLQEKKHGSGVVDQEDVPEWLRNPIKSPNDESHPNVHDRWDWVMDEMIWAFDQINQGKKDGSDLMEIEIPPNTPVLVKNENGNYKRNPAVKVIRNPQAEKEFDDRMNHALYLFGKYFRNLWD